jgi:hypothetical protein
MIDEINGKLNFMLLDKGEIIIDAIIKFQIS